MAKSSGYKDGVTAEMFKNLCDVKNQLRDAADKMGHNKYACECMLCVGFVRMVDIACNMLQPPEDNHKIPVTDSDSCV